MYKNNLGIKKALSQATVWKPVILVDYLGRVTILNLD